MTDADTRSPLDWLKSIYETPATRPELVAVGGLFEFHDWPRGVRTLIRLITPYPQD